VDAQEARARYVEMLMDHVRRDPFPSVDQLNRIEAALTPSTAGDYVEMLLDKITSERFPSPPMLDRIENVAAQLPDRRTLEIARALASRRDEDEDEDEDED
jgi:hypothetical protein